jgi:hypothetical protein
MNYLTLSADMRRVAWWLQRDQKNLADKFIGLNWEYFAKDERVLGKKSLGKWLELIKKGDGGRARVAERALTLSLLLRRMA